MSEKQRTLTLNQRQLCDLELLLNGGFHPLDGFMNEANYNNVLKSMRLENGSLWPMPITLDVSVSDSQNILVGSCITLEDGNGFILATLQVTDIFEPNKQQEALAVFNTTSTSHPGVDYLFNRIEPIYIGGKIQQIQLPMHYDFCHLRHTPLELKQKFQQKGWQRIIAFQTRNPMHKVHYEMTMRAAREANANLLIHPTVGPTQPNDIDYPTRVRCYEALMPHYSKEKTMLSIIPLAMRMAGPREALWHALIRKNYGCTHFIIGRDHAAPENENFYPPYAAQALAAEYANEIGIEIIPFQEMVYDQDHGRYVSLSQTETTNKTLKISGTELRQYLRDDTVIPSWFSFPEVIRELKRSYPPMHQRGFCLFLTGFSAAGKTALASALQKKILETGGRTVTLLDGDAIRQKLSTKLGFSKKDRDLNVLRVGYIASEITKHRGIAICAMIAPYHETRQRVREMMPAGVGFFEIYISTPIAVCEQRDKKGLYAKARRGEITDFTGVNDPYEAPLHPELTIDNSQLTPEEAVQQVLQALKTKGYL